jgi:DNA-binding transcriptional ArsR family regulator
MSRRNPLEALFPKTRREILAALLRDPSRDWYLSDLARHLKVPPSSLQRELAALVEVGILERREDGNRAYYRPDRECPIFGELRGLFQKTAGMVEVVRESLEPLRDRIAVAFIYGSIARDEDHAGSDVDLMLIGDLGLMDLVPALRSAESILMRPVNATVYGTEEAAEKVATGHHFLQAVLGEPRLFVMGGEDELETALGHAPTPEVRGKQARDRRPAKTHRP